MIPENVRRFLNKVLASQFHQTMTSKQDLCLTVALIKENNELAEDLDTYTRKETISLDWTFEQRTRGMMKTSSDWYFEHNPNETVIDVIAIRRDKKGVPIEPIFVCTVKRENS